MTDVEGSTRLWADHPAGMDTAMAHHHEIVHAAITAQGGWCPVDQGEGDAVFAAFDSAPAAAAAVVLFQGALADEPWPEGITIAVRVGVHAGDVITRDGNLFGSTVNRFARLRGLGSGGQVLLSAAVHELVRDELPAGVDVRDLGEHRMKDLTRPEHVYQLVVPGLRADFPQLASLDRARHNLPVQTSSFIGRAGELGELTALVSDHRLVTIVGFGGMGKTRLALQVAAESAHGDGDGVWFVDLSSTTSADQLLGVVAGVLGVSEGANGLLPALVEWLRPRRLLLVLDNLEQLLPDAATIVDALVRAGPDVRILVTSRAPLHLRGEQEYNLGPLPVPPSAPPGALLTESELTSLSTYAAVSLFLTRAAAVRRDLVLTPANAAAVAAICARLDGVPLALELAAARSRVLSPEAMLPRLDHALALLAGGSRDLPTRHQTLRATITWSYDSLTADDQRLLERVSVFPGSFTLEAAEQICGPALTGDDHDLDVLEGISALVDHSLLEHQPGTGDQPEDRYRLLISVRDFAGGRLGTNEVLETLERRHARYFADLVVLTVQPLPPSEQWLSRTVSSEFDNLRTALEHAQSVDDPDLELELARAVVARLDWQGSYNEARRLSQHALDRPGGNAAARLDMALRRECVEYNSGHLVESRSWTLRNLVDARSLGDPRRLVAALIAIDPVSLAEARELITEVESVLATMAADGPAGAALSARQAWDYAHARFFFVDPQWAREATEHRWRETGGAARSIWAAHLGSTVLRLGDLDAADALLGAFETGVPDPADRRTADFGLHLAACLRTLQSNYDQALQDLELADRRLRSSESPLERVEVGEQWAALERLSGHPHAAMQRLLQVQESNPDLDPRYLAQTGLLLAVLSREVGDAAAARDFLARAWAGVAGYEVERLDLILECLLERAVQVEASDPAAAVRLVGLVAAHRGDLIFLDGVRHDTDALLTRVRSVLGEDEVRRILDGTIGQGLPNSADWQRAPVPATALGTGTTLSSAHS